MQLQTKSKKATNVRAVYRTGGSITIDFNGLTMKSGMTRKLTEGAIPGIVAELSTGFQYDDEAQS